MCLFCSKSHTSESCSTFDVNQKKDILKKQSRCFLCLTPAECLKKELCPSCNKPHHVSICFRNQNNPHIISPKGETDNAVSANIVSAKGNTMLQTCSALIDNEKEQGIVRIFLDNGSHR
ncbi:hypothetical protein X975_19554, partial [Stegodyphus mimosarum]